MNIVNVILLFILLLLGKNIYAQDSQVLNMSLALVVGTHKPEFIILINGSLAFKNSEEFIKYIEKLNQGFELIWSPGCGRIGGEPFLSSDSDMKKLRSVLDERKMKFTLIPSG